MWRRRTALVPHFWQLVLRVQLQPILQGRAAIGWWWWVPTAQKLPWLVGHASIPLHIHIHCSMAGTLSEAQTVQTEASGGGLMCTRMYLLLRLGHCQLDEEQLEWAVVGAPG